MTNAIRGEPFEHEADGRQVDEGFRSLDLQLVVFAQATISAQPNVRSTILRPPDRAAGRYGAIQAQAAALDRCRSIGAHGSRNGADEPCFARGWSTSQTPS